MSDFLYTNLMILLAYFLTKIGLDLIPRGSTFAVLHAGRSAFHGAVATTLVRDKVRYAHKEGDVWRFKTSGEAVPPQWAEQLEESLPKSPE